MSMLIDLPFDLWSLVFQYLSIEEYIVLVQRLSRFDSCLLAYLLESTSTTTSITLKHMNTYLEYTLHHLFWSFKEHNTGRISDSWLNSNNILRSILIRKYDDYINKSSEPVTKRARKSPPKRTFLRCIPILLRNRMEQWDTRINKIKEDTSMSRITMYSKFYKQRYVTAEWTLDQAVENLVTLYTLLQRYSSRKQWRKSRMASKTV